MIYLPKKDCYVHIKNRKQNADLRMLLHDNGFTWGSGRSLVEDPCEYDETYFHVLLDRKIIRLCSNIANREDRDHPIIEFTDINDEFIRFYINDKGRLE